LMLARSVSIVAMSPSIVVFCAVVSFVLASTFVCAFVSVPATFATRASTRAWMLDNDPPPATETPPLDPPDDTEARSAEVLAAFEVDGDELPVAAAATPAPPTSRPAAVTPAMRDLRVTFMEIS
jgi:hypothetical protein